MEDSLRGQPPSGQVIGIRHLQVFLVSTAFTICYTLRVNLSVAIVAMVDSSAANPNFPEYDWDLSKQSLIMSSFFWGYVVTQLPAGPLGERFGPKILLLLAVLVSSMLALLTPIAAGCGWEAVCIIRVAQGLSQGVITPSIHNFLSRWSPEAERGRFSGYAFTGITIGTIIAFPLTGVLASSSWGWPSAFYVFGVTGLVWSCLWHFLGSNTPGEDRFISPEEKTYIEENTGITLHRNDKAVKQVAPWRDIFTSLPVYAILVMHCGDYWGFWTLLAEMPTFMKNVLHFDIQENGLLSTLPYIGSWILGYVFAWISDFLIAKKMLRMITARKVFNTIAFWVPAVALVGLGYTSADAPGVAVTLFIIAVAVNSAYMVGFNINHVDLSPNYAGTLMGITNGVGNIMSIFAPLLAGAIITDEESVVQWRSVFFIAAGMYFFCNLFFVIFASSDTQPWNEPRRKYEVELWNTRQNTSDKETEPL